MRRSTEQDGRRDFFRIAGAMNAVDGRCTIAQVVVASARRTAV
jgi:hypothetical protein